MLVHFTVGPAGLWKAGQWEGELGTGEAKAALDGSLGQGQWADPGLPGETGE